MKITIIERGSSIPANKYGGTERVIWGLGYELSKLGHHITFVVPEGSSCPFAKIVEYNPDVPINSLIPKDTDFVHLNFIPDQEPDFPYLVTMHGNPSKEEKLPPNTVFVSKNHANRYNSTTFVHNGLLWEDYPRVDLTLKRDYLHFLAKASWKIKNLSGATEIAIKSGNKLKVMGGEKWKMYNIKRNPLYTLNSKIEYLGMVDNQKKVQVMQQSKGLLFPVLWDEPFGLAMIESLYAGCPVFGTKKGSLPEIVTDNVGFLSDDPSEIIESIQSSHFTPIECHQYAITNFNAKKMALKYLEYYQKVLEGENLT